jgi:hypothetical protein
MSSEAVFILLYSITTGGSTIDAQMEQHFTTKQECMVDRERLLEAHRQSFPEVYGEMRARCEQLKRPG